MIVFDASAVVSAALREDSVPEPALLRAEAMELFALSAEVDAEIAEVLGRPRFARAVTAARRARSLDILHGSAVWFAPVERVVDCRDTKDNMYLDLALAAGVEPSSAATPICWCCIPGAACVFSNRPPLWQRPGAVADRER